MLSQKDIVLCVLNGYFNHFQNEIKEIEEYLSGGTDQDEIDVSIANGRKQAYILMSEHLIDAINEVHEGQI